MSSSARPWEPRAEDPSHRGNLSLMLHIESPKTRLGLGTQGAWTSGTEAFGHTEGVWVPGLPAAPCRGLKWPEATRQHRHSCQSPAPGQRTRQQQPWKLFEVLLPLDLEILPRSRLGPLSSQLIQLYCFSTSVCVHQERRVGR